jgi:hypothetical protein
VKHLKHRLRIVGIFALCVLALWFVIFEWRFIPYNSDYAPIICRSPNHEYYVKRYQTLYEVIDDPLYAKGIAILYDKTGKELYRGHTNVSGMFGPMWFGDSIGFMGGSDWHVNVPSPTGDPGPDVIGIGSCFEEKSEYVYIKPEMPDHPDRDVIIKAVKPLNEVKTEDAYQLQFLVHDQHGVPFTAFRYIITRADGSTMREQTDEKGRSSVIGSMAPETVQLFPLPRQTTDEPKEVLGCIYSPPPFPICLDEDDYKTSAKTIKMPPARGKKQKK